MNTTTSIIFALIIGCAGLAQAQTPAPDKPATVAPRAPAGVDPKGTSEDADYGYKKEKPVKVGGKKDEDGPTAEQAYLNNLRDEAGKPVTYKRTGNVGIGVDGNVIDLYEVKTSTGRTVEIYMDMYHKKNAPKKQLAPKGLFRAR